VARTEGKLSLVTGGGAGISRACCLRLAEEGARVVVTDISEERGDKTVGQIEGWSGHDGWTAECARDP
jgi:NAD(P)-dependent dehydrogenase (short-subunit alcohol dehydrogenase family)